MMKDGKSQLIVCVGAGKAGTSTLYEYMARHPAVSVTKFKETQFFFEDSLWEKGGEWYTQKCFRHKAGEKVLFEADPRYMLHEKCIDRIHQAFPAAKIVVMLRNPIDLAFSLYVYRATYARHKESFEELCETEDLRISSGKESDLGEYGFLARGRYSGQIAHILKRFPRSQVHFIVFERFIKSQETELRKLFNWIGIDPPTSLDVVWENESGVPRLRWLAMLMYHPSYERIRRLMRWGVPHSVMRSRIAGFVGKINTMRYLNRSRPKLDSEVRMKLMADFKEEIRQTEMLTTLDLSVWR